MVMSPLRSLQGITYWVIEHPQDIYDFINANVRKEWEADVESAGGQPGKDPWLLSLPSLVWRLEVVETRLVKLNPHIMNYTDSKKDYSFAESLARRVKELRTTIETYSSVVWPIVLDGEKMELVDGYCRFTILKEMGIPQAYAYVGRTGV